VLIGGLAVFALIVAGQNLWQQYDPYFIRYTDTSVGGIQVGGTVVYQGIAVGTIEAIEIDPENVQSIIVEIRVQDGTPIKEDVVATIVPVGITGISQIELSGGTQDADELEPGSFIPPASSTVGQVTDSVTSILEGIEGVLSDISAVLAQIDQQSVGNILSRIDTMLAENEETVQSLLGELDSAAGGLASATGELDDLIGSVGTVSDDLELLVRRNGPEVEEAIETLNDTLRLLNNFAFQINNDPSLLIVPEER
jgi:phospholipid/cholesterol/gamma-HCH transport system substrate-binding protein